MTHRHGELTDHHVSTASTRVTARSFCSCLTVYLKTVSPKQTSCLRMCLPNTPVRALHSARLSAKLVAFLSSYQTQEPYRIENLQSGQRWKTHKAQIMKLSNQFFTCSYYFLPFWSKYSVQRPVLKNPRIKYRLLIGEM